MATITTLRPSSTSSGSGWTSSPSGALHAVTSDDSDLTWAAWSGAGAAMILATPADAPPAGERRHQARLRARGEDGSAWWAVKLGSGLLVAGASGTFGASPETIVGSWQAATPPDGSSTMSCYVAGQSTGVKITELYLDVDTRLAPTFTPQMLDGTGASSIAISDTASPTVHADDVELDGLAARQYRYWITLAGAIVWDTGVVSSPPVNRATTPLDNGSYVLHAQIWSTLGSNTAYASDEETLAFTIGVGEVNAPSPPTVTPELPFYRVEVCAPDLTEFDGDTAYIEIQRVDCPDGGYLELPGSTGSYAFAEDPLDLVLYDFDVDDEGWVGEAPTTVARVTTPTHDGAGALEATRTFPTTGFGQVRFNDAAGLRDLSANGPTLAAWVLVPAGTPGLAWQARLELQDPGFTWVPGPNFAITPGVWTLITYTPDPVLLADCRSIGFDIGANDVDGAFPVYIDTVMQGYPPFVAPPTDLEITVHASRDDGWRPALDQTLVAKYETISEQRSWRLSLDAEGEGDMARAGRPMLLWSPDGTLPNTIRAYADERPPIDAFGAIHLRVSLDTDNDAGGWTVVFQYQDEDGNWVQIGEPVTGTGTTSIFAGDADLTVGAHLDTGTNPVERFEGRIYSVQVRDGAAGPLLMAPDFTIHPTGTDTFTDSVGVVWTIGPPAALTSSQVATAIAMLGPLESDECVEWVDFTFPRSGVGRSCDHEPVACCSFYRARTVGLVDGAILVSNWSDAFNPGIPEGITVMWPSTAVSIPDGWERVAALDDRYVKGIASVVTEPGTTGGATGHFHTTPGHAHAIDHAHTVAALTSSATGTFSGNPGAAGTTHYPGTHTHTRPTTDTEVVDSQSTAPESASGSNDPARLEVIWISSDGNPTGFPDGSLVFMPDISPSGWTTYANANDRFIKGATAGADGGATVVSQVSNHTHEVEAHIHPGAVHDHTSAPTGATSGTLSFFNGPTASIEDTEHSHPIDVGLNSAAILASASGGTSGTTTPDEPTYRNLRVRENTSGVPDLPVGSIAAWRGALADIPVNWALCDGTNGTPDMIGRYPRGADASIGTAGGGDGAHTHTGATHDHTTTGHSHSSTTGASTDTTDTLNNIPTVTTVTAAHTHALTDTDATTPDVGDASSGTLTSSTTEPPFSEVALVQLLAEPEPPAAPQTFCLEWSDEYHLIRTTGPSGPIYVQVGGKFDWTVDRPFTSATGVMGGRFVTSAPPGGRDLRMVTAVESEAELAQLRAVLARPLVLISPSDSTEVWAAPVSESVRIVKIGRIRQVMADFIATGPEPEPQLADVGA